jgi:hypothetical protein
LNKDKIWKDSIKNGELTYIKADIKNQFTELDKERAFKALKAALDSVKNAYNKTEIAIHRRIIDKKKDHIGKGNTRHFIKLPFRLILKYAKFELSTPYILLGNVLIKQRNGLPMGGFLSAGLAVLDSMYQEHLHYQTWKQLSKKTIICRYRDDILSIVSGILTKSEIQSYINLFQNIYGSNLKVELEDESNKHIPLLSN